jgi:hypothetical protein
MVFAYQYALHLLTELLNLLIIQQKDVLNNAQMRKILLEIKLV